METNKHTNTKTNYIIPGVNNNPFISNGVLAFILL